eukprot:3564666-Pyramimonas_sp.AAC.1
MCGFRCLTVLFQPTTIIPIFRIQDPPFGKIAYVVDQSANCIANMIATMLKCEMGVGIFTTFRCSRATTLSAKCPLGGIL